MRLRYSIYDLPGKRYKHFAKFQNLIDMAYIQLTTNHSVWPLYTIEENPEENHDFTNPIEQCSKRFRSAPGKDIWVRLICRHQFY